MIVSILNIRNILEFILGIAIGIIITVTPREIISPIIIVFAALYFGLLLISLLYPDSRDRDFLRTIFLWGFLIRVFIALAVYFLAYSIKGSGLFGDTWCYSENGFAILQMWLGGARDLSKIYEDILRTSVSGTLSFYDFYNAFIYFFTGKSPLSIIFINAFISTITVFVVYSISKNIYNKESAIIASFLTAFWPSIFFWSIQNLKEPITILLITILIWAFVRLSREFKFRFYLVFLIIVSTMALKTFREVSFYILYLIVLPLSFLLILWKKHKIKDMFFILVLCFSASLFLVLVRSNIICLPSFFPSSIKPVSILEWAYQMRNYRIVDANSAFLVNLDFTKPLGLIIFTPLALLFSWFAPFPWQLGSALQIMAIPEMLIFYLLIPFMFSGIVFAIKNKFNESIIMAVYIFIMFFALAFLEGNIGTLFRHRSLILPFIFVFIGIGIDQKILLKAKKEFI